MVQVWSRLVQVWSNPCLDQKSPFKDAEGRFLPLVQVVHPKSPIYTYTLLNYYKGIYKGIRDMSEICLDHLDHPQKMPFNSVEGRFLVHPLPGPHLDHLDHCLDQNPKKETMTFFEKICSGLRAEDVFTDPSHAWKRKGKRWRGGCPWHDSSSGTCFSVDPDTLAWHCFSCHRGGGPLEYVAELHGIGLDLTGRTFFEAWQALADHTGCEPPPDADSREREAAKRTERQKPRFRPTKIERPPPEPWQRRAHEIVQKASSAIEAAMEGRGSTFARSCYHALRDRGISDASIRTARLGVLEHSDWSKPQAWGIEHDKHVGLPRGVTIPWPVDPSDADRGLWTVRLRRPSQDIRADTAKYVMPKGGSGSGLYRFDAMDKPVVIFEGEFDALHLRSVAGDACTPVATGSITGGQRAQHVARIRMAPACLVAFDAEEGAPIQRAVRFWTERLPHAIRWKPVGGKDPCEMYRADVDTRQWVLAGLQTCPDVS